MTERCHVGCRHCGFYGAVRNREATLDEIVDWTKQVGDYPIGRIIFTGGEPFERVDALEQAIDAVRSMDRILCSFTSSFWATSYPQARAILNRLSGLQHLFLSSDVYHQERVPIERVFNVIQAAFDLGIRDITICITSSNEAERLTIRQQYKKWESMLKFHEDRVIPTQFLPKSVLCNQDKTTKISPDNYATTCYLQTPLINPNGDVLACHAGKAAAHKDMRTSPYFLGNLRQQSFKDIAVEASRRWDYQYLRTQGPKGVAQLVCSNPVILEQVGRDEFTNACDMCFSALRTPEGKRSLVQEATQPQTRDLINIRLAIGLREAPIDLPS